ncbi:MAG: hypothetical protein KDA41_18920, partial [Planctomycetales bacterium]|nr:hypothetical protein [Planctomycetales bacterium]
MKSRRSRILRRKSRGALLIIVLSLLVLFALIALTFVAVAGHHNKSAKTAARVGLFDDQGHELVEQAFYDLLRGTNNPNSALYSAAMPTVCDSLLEDLYGWAGRTEATVSAAAAGSPGGDFVKITPNTPIAAPSTSGAWRTEWGYYGSQVLTMLDGPCAGMSTRIVHSGLDSGTFAIWVEAFDHAGGVSAVPAANNRFLINGRPYGGQEGVDGNESWDAADAMNPHLAYVPTTATAATAATIVKSFATRLAQYDANADGVPETPFSVIASSQRMVDNDRDGIDDSVWIDLGFPVKTAPDGRRYKPLVAILCEDLDGRLNVNAHGSPAHISGTYTATANRNWAANAPFPSSRNIQPRGQGASPADIRLGEIATASGFGVVSSSDYAALLQERYRSNYPTDSGSTAKPGIPGLDMLQKLHGWGVPNSYFAQLTPVGSGGEGYKGYATPIDLLGGGAIAVDFRGRPIEENMGVSEVQDAPQEFNLLEPNGSDTPYTAADIERILRYGDIDSASLSQRLLNVAPTLFNAGVAARRQVTGHSSRIPVPGVPFHIIDRLKTRMGANYSDTQATKMLPPEVLRGGKMNLNRLWGNDRDDPTSGGNGVVDDPAEYGVAQTVYDGVYSTAPTGSFFTRQMYARHLFCLMLLLMEPGASGQAISYQTPTTESGLSSTQLDELTVRRIAQWAINAVDFRDPDAIMTPFEYDVNPFNA